MRFRRRPRYEFQDTPRKRAALARKQRLERERLPLFAADVAALQEDADTVMAGRATAQERTEQDWRDRKAEQWREARRRIAAFPPETAAAIRRAWNEAPYPADPVYLLDYIHGIDVGRIDPFDPPFILRRVS
jgi:hypothetical protein